MSACSVQAMSQVGCRLIVASSAKTSRPFAPGACGDIARALATKAAMSSEAEVFVSGNAPDLSDARVAAAETSPPDFGLVGSRDMLARQWLQAYVAPDAERVNAPGSSRRSGAGIVSLVSACSRRPAPVQGSAHLAFSLAPAQFRC